MAWKNAITFEHPKHGSFPAHPHKVDEIARRWEGYSVSSLQGLVEKWTGLNYSDVHERTSLLIILASFESDL